MIEQLKLLLDATRYRLHTANYEDHSYEACKALENLVDRLDSAHRAAEEYEAVRDARP